MEIQLSWEDPSGELSEQRLSVPIAFGREGSQFPPRIGAQQVSPIVLASKQISRFHALITETNGQLAIADYSSNGTFVNGQRIQGSQPLTSGDTVRIGPYEITITVASTGNTALRNGETEVVAPSSTIVFNPDTDVLEAQIPTPQAAVTPGSSFPPAAFAAERVSIAAINAIGLPIEESDYVALGGGMGSFAWVDTLRCFGVRTEQIVVLGIEKKPMVVTRGFAAILKFPLTKG